MTMAPTSATTTMKEEEDSSFLLSLLASMSSDPVSPSSSSASKHPRKTKTKSKPKPPKRSPAKSSILKDCTNRSPLRKTPCKPRAYAHPRSTSEPEVKRCKLEEEHTALLVGLELEEGFFDWRPSSAESTPAKPAPTSQLRQPSSARTSLSARRESRTPIKIEPLKEEEKENVFLLPPTTGQEVKRGDVQPTAEVQKVLDGRMRAKLKAEEDLKRLLEGAETWDWGDMLSSPVKGGPSPIAASKTVARAPEPEPTESSSSSPNPLPCMRCSIDTINVIPLRTAARGHRTEFHILAHLPHSTTRILLILRDDWTELPLQPLDTLTVHSHLLPAPSQYSPNLATAIVDGKQGFVVHHPDVLLPPTMVSTAGQCLRKPLVSALLRSSSMGGEQGYRAVLWGNLLHEVVQRCLTSASSSSASSSPEDDSRPSSTSSMNFPDGDAQGEKEPEPQQGWSSELIDHHLRSVLYSPSGIEGCFRAGVSVDEALRELQHRASGLIEFSRRFLRSEPSQEGVLADAPGQESEAWAGIRRAKAVEEDIWSPGWGLKGKVDASVDVVLSEPAEGDFFAPRRSSSGVGVDGGKAGKGGQGRKRKEGTMPFEIKTGRAAKGLEHRAQTMLYTLLLGERYHTHIPSGLLYYTQSAEVIRVEAKRNELRGLLMLRNELAEWVMKRRRGLDSIAARGSKKSKKAIQASSDDASDTLVLDGGETELGDIEEPNFLPAPLDDSWACSKCYAVDGCMLYRRTHDAPLSVPPEIEDLYEKKTGHLTPRHAAFFRTWERLVSLEENDMNRFRAELWTMPAHVRESAGRCFADMVRLPLREGEDAISQGSGRMHRHTARFVKRATTTGSPTRRPSGEMLLNGHISVGDPVVVSLEDPEVLAVARGFVLSLSPDSVVLGLDQPVDEDSLKHLPPRDPDRWVWRIDKDELSTGVARLRDNLAQLFYAGGDERRRALVVDLEPPVFSSGPALDVASFAPELNVPQQAAVAKVAAAKDYALILGMPGTGKTSTVAEIIRMLVKQGKTVLLTSYTHSAVDTILLRLGEVDFDVLRLGNTDKVHPDARKYTLGARPPATTVQQLEHQLLTPPVVATTCLSIDHPLFSRRKFDYCIVDEASQITLPTCIGPLRFADVFVLVGDHFQLPPLVKNRAARKGGLDVSLFRRLSDAHPEAVVDLTMQYRMNEDIMLLSNKLIYSDRLQCGSEEVARRSLVLPDRAPLEALHASQTCDSCWLNALLDERCKAVFVDTDALPARDGRVGDLVQNTLEAELVFQLSEILIRCGVPESDIGILSLYRQQIKLLSHLFRSHPAVEILTADRSQGRDKEVILISMVRSNETGELGDLLKDWRRINVSFTRARSKLVIFGSRSTLGASQLMEEFFGLMEGRGWIYPLQPGAHLIHREQLGTPEPPAPVLKRSSEEPEPGTKIEENRVVTKKFKLESPSPAKRAVLSDIINSL